MKVTFIRLAILDKNYDSFKPLVFPIINEITPKDVEVEFIDEQVEKLPDEINSEIIAFSVETLTAKKAYILAKKFKKKNNVIVMGGFHPTVEPDEALEFADVVLMGDAEDTWVNFLSDYRKGNYKNKYISTYNGKPTKIDYNFSYFKGKKYPSIGAVQFSRGCKFNCDFCSIKTMYKNGVLFKDVDTVIEEVKQIKEKLVFFVDDNLFVNEKVSLELFRKMKKLNKLWGCQISMDIAQNDKMLQAMKDSGCVVVLIGFESINPDTLKRMNKGANMKLKDYDAVIKNIYRYGIMICATFVFGYDLDTSETIRQTFDFAMKYHFTKVNFNMLVPMPGTRLYKRLEENKRLLMKKWWINDKYVYGMPVYKPKLMQPEELKKCCKSVWREYYTIRNIMKRTIKNSKYINIYKSIGFFYESLITRKTLYADTEQILGGILGKYDS